MNKTTTNHKVLCGFIKGVHGVRGLVKVEKLSDNPLRFAAGSLLEARFPHQAERILRVETASMHKGYLLVQFADVNSKEEADKLRGAELFGDIADTIPLPEGQFYHFQLLGLKVIENGIELGQISEILERPANDIYLLKNTDGKEILIPALKQVVKRVDLEQGIMEVELPAGLLEE